MLVCANERHDEIVHDKGIGECPLCALIRENDQLNSDVNALTAEIKRLMELIDDTHQAVKDIMGRR